MKSETHAPFPPIFPNTLQPLGRKDPEEGGGGGGQMKELKGAHQPQLGKEQAIKLHLRVKF